MEVLVESEDLSHAAIRPPATTAALWARGREAAECRGRHQFASCALRRPTQASPRTWPRSCGSPLRDRRE
jgi:hypothetical protein